MLVNKISIQVLNWLAAHFQTVLLAIIVTNVIQHQNVWKISLICHLKHSFNFLGKKRIIKSVRMNFAQLRELVAISPHIQKMQQSIPIFPRSFLSPFPPNSVVATANVTKWPEIVQHYRNRSTEEPTRFWKISHT